MLLVVRVAEVSARYVSFIRGEWSDYIYSEIVPLSPMVMSPSCSVGNFPSPPASFLKEAGASPFSRFENLTS